MTRVTTTSSEIFIATITTDDREHITLIARTIADVATVEIKEIMQGQGDVLILEPPEEPAGPVSPNMRSNVLAGAAVGLVLACAFVVIRTLTDTKIWTEDDLARAYEIPVLGTIPQLAGTERQTGQKE
jgi:capsular polysaccharide biosynthesis protein